MAENKNAKTPTDGGAGFIDGVWHGPKSWQCQCGRPYTVTCISSKPPKREWVGLTGDEVKVKTEHDRAVELGQAYEQGWNAALAQREWVGLTDEEIQDLSYLSQKIDEGNSPWFDRLGFARAIEQALKEKNQ
jgi:hypothetical protein